MTETIQGARPAVALKEAGLWAAEVAATVSVAGT